jgi:hypothetical protein
MTTTRHHRAATSPKGFQSSYANANRAAWDHWAALGSISSQPIDRVEPASARFFLDPDGWLPWDKIHTVLCLVLQSRFREIGSWHYLP